MATFTGVPRFSFERGIPETGSIGARTAAFALDLVLLLLLDLMLAGVLVAMKVVAPPDLSGGFAEAAQDPFVLFVILIEAPIDLAYFVAAETVWGRSVGKLALGLRVVREDGARPTLAQASLRNLLRFLWFVPYLFLAFVLIDWYLMRVGEMDQRIGDLAAKTYVVKDGVWWPPGPAGAKP